ncbi:AT-hook motif nuclear-localized protein 14-like protein [Cinnamomum micranthum f. kanehirae]|uniref:AT-hook motif nuclear-localized protein n=1 Tax=Cinnamomum micranthum f. kanehirae TaxID=337451 RepID=A0A3S3MT57_9MAGN|nr:AT-hook motif nuclear-localized protein 14-like protein [Cinnamomum micranthum f. kanehirae]
MEQGSKPQPSSSNHPSTASTSPKPQPSSSSNHPSTSSTTPIPQTSSSSHHPPPAGIFSPTSQEPHPSSSNHASTAGILSSTPPIPHPSSSRHPSTAPIFHFTPPIPHPSSSHRPSTAPIFHFTPPNPNPFSSYLPSTAPIFYFNPPKLHPSSSFNRPSTAGTFSYTPPKPHPFSSNKRPSTAGIFPYTPAKPHPSSSSNPPSTAGSFAYTPPKPKPKPQPSSSSSSSEMPPPRPPPGNIRVSPTRPPIVTDRSSDATSPASGGLKRKYDQPLGWKNPLQAGAFPSSSFSGPPVIPPSTWIAGRGFTPYFITVASGEHNSKRSAWFALFLPLVPYLCATLSPFLPAKQRKKSVTKEGLFEILSLSGSYLHFEIEGGSQVTGGLSVCLSANDGSAFGGIVKGALKAAGPVQVTAASYVIDMDKDSSSVVITGASGPTTRGMMLPFASDPPKRAKTLQW